MSWMKGFRKSDGKILYSPKKPATLWSCTKDRNMYDWEEITDEEYKKQMVF